ncbi:MAG: phage portal protein, partial [Bryobacteraceae bacterium]
MNIFKSFVKRFAGANVTQPSNFSRQLFDAGLGSDDSIASVNSVASGMKQPTVYTCIKRIADAVAQTPLLVLANSDGGSEKARSHSVYRVLNTQANSDMTSYTWKHVTTVHVLGHGNAFSYIERNKAGQVIGLNPMNPDDVKIEGRTADGQLLYSWTDKHQKRFLFPASDILHVRGLSFDGIIGCSPILQLKTLVGRAKTREEFSTRFYRNGAQLGGVITAAEAVSPEQLEELRKSFQETYAGARNAGKVLLLEGTQKFDPVGVSPKDAEFVESTRLDAGTIAASFGCPLQMINDVQTTTRASAEELFRQFLLMGLNPVFSNLEAEINIKLFTRPEQDIYYSEFLRESLVEADFQQKIEGLNKQIMGGLLTPNEGRAKLNMNPQPFGDSLMMAANITTLENIIDGTATAPAPPQRHLEAPTVVLSLDRKRITGAVEQLTIEHSGDHHTETITRLEKEMKERSRNGRKHITKSIRIVLKDAFQRIGKRERQDVSKMVLKNLRDQDAFVSSLSTYYAEGSPFAVYFLSVVTPILNSLSESLKHQVQGEIKGSIEGDADEFSKEYLTSLANRYSASSRRQIEKILAELEDGDDPAEVVERRLGEWEEGTSEENPDRADKESDRESNRMSNALTRFFLVAGGVTRLVWTTSGNECPICAELDGKVVGVED